MAQQLGVAAPAADQELPPPGAEPAGGRSRRGFDWQLFASRYGTIFVILALGAWFTSASPGGVFLTRDNLVNIVQQGSVLAILAAGLTVVLVLGDFDLSIAGVAILGNVTYAAWARDSGSVAQAVVVALLVCGAVGIANGLVVTKLRVPPFIATLAMGLFIVEGLQTRVARNGTISSGFPADFRRLGNDRFLGVRVTVWVAAVVLVALWLLLRHSVLGRNMQAVGGNRVAARLSGIALDRTRLVGYGVSGLCAGSAGVLLASTFGVGSPSGEGTLLLDAFTAAFIGASTLKDGEFHIPGTAIGVFFIGMLTNGLTLIGFDTNLVPVAKGVLLILAVAAAGLLRRS